MTKGGGKTYPKEVNEYEEKRLLTIQANKEILESLGIKRVAASLNSLIETTKEKKRKKRRNATQEDDDFETDNEYVPKDDHMNKECEKEPEMSISARAKTSKTNEGKKKSTFIPPMSLANFLKKNKKHTEGLTKGDETSVSKALKIVEEAFRSQEQLDDIDGMLDEESNGNHLNSELEKENEESNEIKDEMEMNYKEDGVSMDLTDRLNAGIDPILSGTIRKTRGMVYCRKLTALPPGEKIKVEFDENGRPIGPHARLYTYFLGQQVRNRSVCPVKVKGWEEYQSETLNLLWACIKEKCVFDDPKGRKEGVLKHARRLFRDSRHKLKEKYFNDQKLTTKEQRLKNKPKDMHKTDWKYLVEHWSDPKFEKEKNGGKCSRVDLLIESRTRKSKNRVDDETLAKNLSAVDNLKKLKEQREQGLNKKTDEQIFLDVLGKDTHGYLQDYGPGKSITQHFNIKPSRIDLHEEVVEVKKKAEQAIQEARKKVEDAKREAEDARKEADEARKDAEFAKNEAKTTRKEIDQKISMNSKIWQKKLKQILESFGLQHPDDDDSSSDEQ